MAFPANPTNGQTTVQNNITYTYNSTKDTWTKLSSVTSETSLNLTGNANVGNLGTGGLIVATGNITGGNLITTGNANVGNLNITGNIVDSGAITISTGSNGNIGLAPNGTGVVTSTANISNSARYIKTSTGGLAGGASGNITRYGSITTSTIGDIHITTSTNGNATVSLNYGITFAQPGGTQAGIIISENGSDGTGIGFYATNNYTTGPQLRMSIESNGNILPGGNVTQNLGSATLRWSTIFTGDLDLSNGIGDWTIVEGEEDLFIYNNKKGKVYKFALIEVDPATAPPKKEN